jgi:hypothetical protein
MRVRLACQYFFSQSGYYISVKEEHACNTFEYFHFGTAGRVVGALPLLKPDPLAEPAFPLLLPPEKLPPKPPKPPPPLLEDPLKKREKLPGESLAGRTLT